MGNLMEAFLAIMGLASGFFALAILLNQPVPMAARHETISPERSHAIHPLKERMAA